MNDLRGEPALAEPEGACAPKAVAMLTSGACRSRAASLAAILSLGIVGTGCLQTDRVPTVDPTRGAVPSFAPVVREVMPAVVNVAAIQKLDRADSDEEGLNRELSEKKTEKQDALEELLRRFLESHDRKAKPAPKLATVALGSGFVIDPRGYVVTDDHVVENAEKVTIILQDAAEYPARVVGRDPLTDLALLKIDPDRPLSYVRWGDSDTAQIGDWVLAIGNPFGLDNTVSSGIISGRGRDIHSGPYDDYLQIDAAINRGNSGGPTFDLHGNVIGVNTAIYSPNGGSVGIGFAVPANRAKPVLEQLRDHGKVARGWLGIHIQPVTPQLVQALGLPSTSGALVSGVGAGSPAAAAGFQAGDVILAINGQKIRRMRELPLTVAEMPIGQRAAVTVWRGNAPFTLQPVISEMPVNPEVAELPRENFAGRPERRTAAPSLIPDTSSAI